MRNFWGKAYLEREAGEFSVGHWIADSFGEAVEPHGHNEAHIMFITGGEFLTNADNAKSKNDFLMIYNPPDTFHCDRFVSSSGGFFTVSIPAMTIREIGEISLPPAPTVISHFAAHALVNEIMRECCYVGVRQSDVSTTVESLCFELLAVIGNCPAAARRLNTPQWLRTACEVLQDCYAEKISINDLSRAIGIHPIHLTRTFRAFYRCTPGEFLRNRRLQKAAEMLISANLPVTEIALESGFFDQSHLTRHFRQKFGVPPGEFRSILNRSA